MFTCEWDILTKLILGTDKLVHYSLQFAVHIENGENGWCEMSGHVWNSKFVSDPCEQFCFLL